MRVRKESGKTGFKLNIQKKIKSMTLSPITSWQIDGEKMETVKNFIFLGFKITVDGDYSHEINKYLLDSVLKNKDITLLTKVHIVRAMVFPEVMCGCES